MLWKLKKCKGLLESSRINPKKDRDSLNSKIYALIIFVFLVYSSLQKHSKANISQKCDQKKHFENYD